MAHRHRLTALVLLAASLSVARPARASGSMGLEGLQALAGLMVLVLVVDVGFAAYDITQAARGKLPSRGLSVVETLVAAPQVYAGVELMKQGSRSTLPAGIAVTAFTATLTAHGIWGFAIAQPRDAEAKGPAAQTQPAGFGVRLGGSF